jgi:hypothetical protein
MKSARTYSQTRLLQHGFAALLAVALPAALLQAAVPAAAAPATAPAASAPPTPRSAAQFDMTGHWVSIVSEDWMYRMMQAPKGDFGSVPLNAAGKQAALAWDAARDAAQHATCKAYGAPGLIRRPGRLTISWRDDRTLQVDFDAGMQTRLLHFAEDLPAAGYTASEPPSRLEVRATGEPTLQGRSLAAWHKQAQSLGMGPNASTTIAARGGSLAVVTTNLIPGYLQSNGIPYSGETILREFFDLITLPDGRQWLVVTSIVEDPQNLLQPFVTSTQFRREPDGSKWDPGSC